LHCGIAERVDGDCVLSEQAAGLSPFNLESTDQAIGDLSLMLEKAQATQSTS
jgi:hypothetical protein